MTGPAANAQPVTPNDHPAIEKSVPPAAVVDPAGKKAGDELQVRHAELNEESFVMVLPPPPPDNGSTGDDILIRVER